jgi:hypothetical protein
MYATNLEARFSRMGLGGQSSAAPSSTQAADATTAVLSAATNTAASALGALKAMRSRLNGDHEVGLRNIEQSDRLRRTARTNRDVVSPPPGSVPTFGESITLARTPSFLLAEPILSDIGEAMPRGVAGFVRPMSEADRALLTAQVAQVRLQIKTNQQQAADQARRGERIRTLPFETQRFDTFLDSHKPLLRQVIAACERDGADRNEILERGLASLATDYLRTVGRLPTGLDEGEYVEMDGKLFDNASVSVSLVPEKGMADRKNIECDEQDKLIIWLKTDGVDELEENTYVPDNGVEGWSEQLADCSIGKQKAGVLLQNLFFALATTEEAKRLEEENAAERRGTRMSAAARSSEADLEYEGTAAIGDDFDDRDGSSQRTISVVPLETLPFRINMHQGLHDTSPLTDTQLERWVNSPAIDSDIRSLTNPNFRMRMAQIDVVGQALQRTGLFPPS